MLPAVRHEHLGGLDLVAGVALRLYRYRLAQLGEPGRGRVLVEDRLAGRLCGRLDDVRRGGEVGLAGAEADDVLTRRFERFRLRVDGQRGGLGDGSNPL